MVVSGGVLRSDHILCAHCIPLKGQRKHNKRSIDNTKRNEFIFLVADGTAKLSGRDCEFREPTPRRKQTEGSEVFSEKFQDESGESQPTEATDDAEARKDFCSIQCDFVCRHHNEPRVHLHVPKEETFPIPQKYNDVPRSNLDACRWLLECRFGQMLVRFVERFHEVYSIERETSTRIHVVRWEIDKSSNDFQTISCMARSMDQNW